MYTGQMTPSDWFWFVFNPPPFILDTTYYFHFLAAVGVLQRTDVGFEYISVRSQG